MPARTAAGLRGLPTYPGRRAVCIRLRAPPDYLIHHTPVPSPQGQSVNRDVASYDSSCYASPAMPRQARLDAPGVLHHVMVRGIERRAIFRDDTDRADFVMGDVGSKACYAFWGAERFCHVPVVRAHKL